MNFCPEQTIKPHFSKGETTMKAQAGKTPEINFNPTEEVTPVIVKIGGGDAAAGNSENGNEFSIYSPVMPFMDSTGDMWNKAWSTSTGRIHELSLEKGDQKTMYCEVTPQPNMVTSLEVTMETLMGEGKIRMYEKPEGDSFLLYIESHGVPFHATDETSKGWKNSHLTGTPVKLLFTQKQIGATENNVKFEYIFAALPSDITFTLDFHVTAP
jgi:hypothetical protein